MPPGILRGELYLAYVDSQTNPQICSKFGANRSSHLTASLNICDPLNPPSPKCPWTSWETITKAYHKRKEGTD